MSGCHRCKRLLTKRWNLSTYFNFQSTQMTSVTYDDVAHTVTIVGTGTDNGLPVTFTIGATDSTVIPPGMFSIALSDGYVDGDSLLDGSIQLQ
jgi:hypothetical protein